MTKTQLIEEWQSKIDVSKNASLNDIVTAAEVRELIADAMEAMYLYTLKG